MRPGWLDAALVPADGDGPEAMLARLCEAAVLSFGVSGAAVMVMAGDEPRGTVGATDDVARLVEEIEFSLGEGPGTDVHAGGLPVLEANLAEAGRWPAYARAAADAGIGAVFVFPLQVGMARLGSMALYRRQPGPLTDGGPGDGVAAAEAATRVLLALLAEVPPGALPAALEDVSAGRAGVHQAAGMVSVQAAISLADALVRLRARAFADGRGLGDVAADVVARRLVFEGE